jgi:hypothetical protein
VNPSDPRYQIRAVWLKNETSAPVKNFIDALKLETELLKEPAQGPAEIHDNPDNGR